MRTYEQYQTELASITDPEARLAFAKQYAQEEEEYLAEQALLEAGLSKLGADKPRPDLTPPKKKWGGKREKSGRPKLPVDVDCTRFSIRIDSRDLEAWNILKSQYNRQNRELFTHAINLLTDYINHARCVGHPERGLSLKLTKSIL
jgi:hypothetical protein